MKTSSEISLEAEITLGIKYAGVESKNMAMKPPRRQMEMFMV